MNTKELNANPFSAEFMALLTTMNNLLIGHMDSIRIYNNWKVVSKGVWFTLEAQKADVCADWSHDQVNKALRGVAGS